MPTLPVTSAPVEWVASSLDDLREFPEDVRSVLHAVYLAQTGGKHPDAKPMTGDPVFRGAGVLEVVDDYDGNTYRAVYTVRFSGVVHVLHAFRKQSRSGIATPRSDIEKIKRRLKLARDHYEKNYGKLAG